MTAQIIDGKKVANLIQTEIATQVSTLITEGKRCPGLAVIQVGENPASTIYVNKKRQTCEKVGIHSQAYDLPETTSQQTLLDLITELNQSEHIDGILVQLPLPLHIDPHGILEHIDPHKDVDGFHPLNLGRLAQRRPILRPCTPYGIMLMLEYYGIKVRGLAATIVGASNIVGRPMALELLMAGASVSITHRFTRDLATYVRQAELLVVAVGNPTIVKSEWIKTGAIVIDVGMNRLSDGKVVGDIEFDSAAARAGWITPVPGGVGPMTVTTLLKNTLISATQRYR